MIFDRRRHQLHMKRAGIAPETFLLEEMCERLAERLEDISRTFPLALDIGSYGHIAPHIPAGAGVQKIVSMGREVDFNEEALPFADGSFDLVLACGSLHWVNDLPGTLIQIQRMLKPDGLFLAMLPGGETLHELRMAFEVAELEVSGGISPRVSPFVDIRDAGSLLQRAGFALPVVDSILLDVQYKQPFKLMQELRAMGQSNALAASRKYFTSRTLMQRMAAIYQERYANEDGRIPATFELLTLTAWKPHHSQQQPAKRGSGEASLSLLGN